MRSTMANLIDKLRRMVHDPASSEQVFDNIELQDILDANRADVRYMELAPVPTVASGGNVTYLAYAATGLNPGLGTSAVGFPPDMSGQTYGDWESDVVLCDGTYATITPAASDYERGVWTLSASQDPPVYLTGATYDMAGAAADVYERWMAVTALEVDYANAGVANTWEKKLGQLQAMRDMYRGRMRPVTGRLVRGDENA